MLPHRSLQSSFGVRGNEFHPHCYYSQPTPSRLLAFAPLFAPFCCKRGAAVTSQMWRMEQGMRMHTKRARGCGTHIFHTAAFGIYCRAPHNSLCAVCVPPQPVFARLPFFQSHCTHRARAIRRTLHLTSRTASSYPSRFPAVTLRSLCCLAASQPASWHPLGVRLADSSTHSITLKPRACCCGPVCTCTRHCARVVQAAPLPFPHSDQTPFNLLVCASPMSCRQAHMSFQTCLPFPFVCMSI
jgi:hypothetical protein